MGSGIDTHTAMRQKWTMPKVKGIIFDELSLKEVEISVNELSSIYNQIPYDESVDSLVRHATVLINALEDSLAQQIQDQENLKSINQSLNQHINYLKDSLSMVLLEDKIVQLNLNQAMKHLSQSLAYYYTQNYNDALEETDKAIAIFPDTAAADPPDEPPGTYFLLSFDQGLIDAPKKLVSFEEPIANSSRFVFPKRIAPASQRFFVTVDSYVGIKFSNILEAAVV